MPLDDDDDDDDKNKFPEVFFFQLKDVSDHYLLIISEEASKIKGTQLVLLKYTVKLFQQKYNDHIGVNVFVQLPI